ncbi:flagellin [Sporosarcina saromensis]|uniref:Flagellin n=1 Tax=Sporosarcina saromensis TaxID=359365 RepID=A0ABU4G6J9_9BACL|nr:flagellin [Sporosarcina saromensis]MDW0112603.1 flagellin [Sporosarcina saromensis]
MMIIRQNILGLKVSNKLDATNRKASNSLKRLSSGLKINQAADDAAGLAISEKMRAQIRGLDQANKNIQDAVSLIMTAEKGLSDISDPSLLRIRELVVEAANGTLNSQDRLYIQQEVDQLKKGINDIANNTHFNGINLLNQIVKDSSLDEVIIQQGLAAKLTVPNPLVSSFQVFAGQNDTFEFQVNGKLTKIQIPPGQYNRNSLLEELNSKLKAHNVPLTASYSEGLPKLEFTSPIGDYSIENVTGDGTEGYLITLVHASRTGGVARSGLPALNPGITITFGVNDTLTFEVNSKSYSISIPSGEYTVYGALQSDQNENSTLLEHINTQLNSVGAPVKAQFIYYKNPDPPFNNGTGLYFTALESPDKSSSLADGMHTFGNFGGNAKSTLFDSTVSGWNVKDSSTLESGIIKTHPAFVTGEADLSKGLVIVKGENDTFNFDLNGNEKSITLRPDSYSALSLINEINYQLNSNNIEVTAELNSSNKIVIKQTNPTSGDKINHLSGNAMPSLFYEIIRGKAPVVETNIIPSEGNLNVQVGPNSGDSFKIALTNVGVAALGIDDLAVMTIESANKAIAAIDNAIKIVSSERGRFGSYQNRLEYATQQTSVAAENLTAAESRIRDVDYVLVAA